jgi:Predicted ATP-dependent serine protease
MPKKLEHDLMMEAVKKNLKGKRKDAYIFGTMGTGRQIIIPPSVVEGKHRAWVDMIEPSKMGDELKDFLLSQIDTKVVKAPLSISNEPVVVEGNRNNMLIHLGGVIRSWCNPVQVANILWLINQHFIMPPLPKPEIEAMARSIAKYDSQDFVKFENKIYEYLKMTEGATIHDIKDFTKEDRTTLDIALYNLREQEKVLKSGNRFYVLNKVEWKQDFHFEQGQLIPFKMPYFDEIANFCWGDLILLGGKPSIGKTTVAMNIAKQLSVQGIVPYYINLESGSRFCNTATRLGLRVGDMHFTTASNPQAIELEKNAVTILDWLLIDDKFETDKVFKYFSEQLKAKGGVLIIFQQLRDNNEYFAKDMVRQFPSFSARYIYDDEAKNREFGSFKVDKNRDPKGRWVSKLPCRYDRDTMVLDLLDTELPVEAQKVADYFGGRVVD